jgi:spermidine synthase
LGTAVELLSTYAGQDRDLKPWLEGAQINHDGDLRLQYMAGLAVNANAEQAIYNEMLRYRRFPSNLLTGREGTVRALEAALNGGGR